MCFDYNKIGCKSRRDCVDRCKVEWAFKNCNGSFPSETIINRYNDKNKFKDECRNNYKEYCEEKHKSPDCINEYYTAKLMFDKKHKEFLKDISIDFLTTLFDVSVFKTNKNAKADINLVSTIDIEFNNELDTIYTHSPQQYPIEFMCLIGGIISLWTGFSIFSIYAHGKHVFNRRQNKIKEIRVNAINNSKKAMFARRPYSPGFGRLSLPVPQMRL